MNLENIRSSFTLPHLISIPGYTWLYQHTARNQRLFMHVPYEFFKVHEQWFNMGKKYMPFLFVYNAQKNYVKLFSI